MTMLATIFREQMKKTKDLSKMSEMTYSVSYGTGFLPLDYATGYVQEVNGMYKFELGLSDGSINTLIGQSGVGKTSLLIAMACNIIKPFRTSSIFVEQAEVGTNIQRIKNLSGIRDDNGFVDRFIVRDAGITVESIFQRVKSIHDIKMSHKDQYLYDTGMVDMNGKPIYKFEPTVFIVDSVKLVLSEQNSSKDNTDNMTGANDAKANSQYYSKMVPLCRSANIIMILVNHITVKINTERTPQPSEFPFLGQNEHLGSAKLLHYISNLMLKLVTVGKYVRGKDNNPFDIDGTLVGIDIVKSRTNKSGRQRCVLVFNQEVGFDQELSMFMMLKINGIIEGSGAYLRIPGCDVKFAAKNFKKILYSNEEFFNAFNACCFKFVRDRLIAEYQEIQKQSNMVVYERPSYDAIIANFSEMKPLSSISQSDSAIIDQVSAATAADIQLDSDEFDGDLNEEEN